MVWSGLIPDAGMAAPRGVSYGMKAGVSRRGIGATTLGGKLEPRELPPGMLSSEMLPMLCSGRGKVE